LWPLLHVPLPEPKGQDQLTPNPTLQKLEQTVAGNARLEQELLLLRQKVQATRGGAATNGLGGDSPHINGDASVLASELERVQSLVGDMQRQRHELSSAVRQLTENSTRLYQEIGNKEMNGGGSTNGSLKKRSNSTSWTETDLDANMLRCGSRQQLNDSTLNLSTPLYVDTNSSTKLSDYNRYNGGGSSDALEMSGVDSDGFLDSNPFAIGLEKPEIKTVRIVKRESERRNRDRSERGLSSSIQNLDQVLEEEQYAQQQREQQLYAQNLEEQMSNGHQSRSKSLPRNYSEPPKQRHSRHLNGKQQNGHHYNNGFDYDRNSNYEHQPPPPPAPQSNGHHHHPPREHREQREHLNPLANAYFAKQLQQQVNPSRDSARVALRTKTDSLQSLNKSLTELYAGNGTPSGLATSTPQNHPQFRMRRTGSRAEIDMLERETSSQIRVSPSRKTLNRISEYYHYFALKPDPFKGHNHNL